MGLFSAISNAAKSTSYLYRVTKHIDAATRPGTANFMCSQPGMSDAMIAIAESMRKDGCSVEECAEAICATFCSAIGI